MTDRRYLSSVSFSFMDYSIKQIAGIPVLFAPTDGNSTTIQILVKAGSIYENRENNGISHFLEHMFFKGGKKYTTPHDVAAYVDTFGGEFNAFTAEEYAWYYVKAAPEHAPKALDVLADMMVHPAFPKDEMEREKWVVIQELKMYEDRPDRQAFSKFKTYMYGDNSYGREIIGTEDNIRWFTQEDLFQHKEQLYTKDNMLIVVAGNILQQEVLEWMIEELFDSLPTKKSVEKPAFVHHLPEEKTMSYNKGTQQAHVVIGAWWYDSSKQERFAASLLGVILGGNMSSRLFQNIREKLGMCYYIYGTHYANTDDGLFLIRAGLEKERLDEWLSAIYKEIEQIAAGNITEKEYEKAQWFMTGKTQMGIESSDELADFLGAQQLLKGKIQTLDAILEEYTKVGIDDLKKVAQNLADNRLYTYYIS